METEPKTSVFTLNCIRDLQTMMIRKKNMASIFFHALTKAKQVEMAGVDKWNFDSSTLSWRFEDQLEHMTLI